ncbi:hypothetical protein PAESOLCIP111_05532 [Paenibacillus solanacearum]|uniref:SLH domain-containing protein n=1 Tax=Paenibacillus solanacearum TaxID=2048548 RepID=A0A916K6B1_9BACL|nr:S-layer homology domain-containing protein [Paenibacillus solanacearum]CAG7648093.1 hypothetical protein PAESOLCIP111_05532 [Paenibacillus solanacearum]
MFKKITAFGFALSIGITTAIHVINADPPAFSDITGHWGQQAIMKAVEGGIVDGYPDGTFKPDMDVSRAEFITMLTKALKLKTSEEGATWYSKYNNAVVEAGIHRYEEFSQDINGAITRQEMMRLSLRATRPDLQYPEVEITDKAVVYQAVKTGLIQGLDRGALGLDQATTRAQAMTVVDRVLQANRGEGDKLIVDKQALNLAELELRKTNIFTVMPEIFGGTQIVKWNPDNLSVETGDGLYKATMDQIIAIDLEDPDDPNLSLLGDFDTLKWYTGLKVNSPYIKDGYMNSYVLYFKGHVDFNNDPSIYKDTFKQPNFTLYGFKSNEPTDKQNGILSNAAPLFRDSPGDIPALIIPKKYFLDSDVAISISAPAIPPAKNYNKRIISISTSKK